MSPAFVKLLAEIRASYALVQAGALRRKRWVREGASSYTVDAGREIDHGKAPKK
jgi:hypothetical protein